MTKLELIQELKDQGLQGSVFSFYSSIEDGVATEMPDTEFGHCDLSGERGDLVNCTTLDTDGNIVNLQVGTWLVHGHLGKLAGAF
ncbi:MAG: hypothetical protein HC836_46905 [Richelia sp. RM2_1_2]|nr:hypothetical protein [Richelia sp. RM2_1_2]